MIATPEKPQKIGWIGTGVMGRWMCQHLMERGYQTLVHNRSRSKAEPLIASGAAWAASPAEVARQADIVFTMVGFPQDVRTVYLEKEGILAGARKGTIAVDMTTTEPSLAKEIYAAAEPGGVHTVDAPVSGGDVGARNAQ